MFGPRDVNALVQLTSNNQCIETDQLVNYFKHKEEQYESLRSLDSKTAVSFEGSIPTVA